MVVESEDEFFIYLSSDRCKDIYTWNAGNSFTNRISPHIYLNTEYEVALQNIVFKNDFLWIKKNDRNFSISFSFKYTHENGNLGGYGVRYTCQEDITGKDIISVIRCINIDVKKYLFYQKIISQDHGDIFTIDESGEKVTIGAITPADSKIYTDFEVVCYMSDGFRQLFGVPDDKKKFILTTQSLENVFSHPKLKQNLQVAHVYTDIIEPSSIGNQKVHILDILPINPTLYQKTSNFPMFKRVTRRIIDEISVRITDQYGGSIPFADNVNVTVILHFKRRL